MKVDMRRIGLFVAGSRGEFAAEFDELFDFLRLLNDALVSTGQIIRVRTDRREPAATAIPESERFYLFMGTRLAESTSEEFDVAWESFQSNRRPLITVYLRDLEESRLDERARAFKAHIAEDLSHYYATFSHLDTVKLGMMLDLARLWGMRGEVFLRNGSAFLGDEEVFSVEDAPFYANRSQIVKLRRRLEELDAEYAKVEGAFDGKSGKAVRERLGAIDRQRGEVASHLHELESNLLDLFELIGDRNVEETPRTIEASRHLEEGDYEAALETLSTLERRRDLVQGRKLREAGRALVRGYITESRMEIGILLTQLSGPEDVARVKELYADLCDVVLEENFDLDVLLDYASFLLRENELTEALDYAELYLDNLRRGDPDSMTYPAKLIEAEVQARLERYPEAREAYEALVEEYRELAEADPIAYKSKLSRCLDELSQVCMSDHDLEAAVERSREALEIRSELATSGGESAQCDLAKAMQDHAVILRKYNHWYGGVETSEIDGLYREALVIARELADVDPVDHLGDVAWYANNYAVFLTRLLGDEREDAVVERTRELLDEALAIRERLANVDPGANLRNVAWTESCYGNFLRVIGEYEEAEKRYERSLELRRQLAEFDSDAFEGDVAWSLNSLGGLYEKWGRLDDAERCHRDALAIYERLMRAKPSRSSRSRMAQTCNYLEKVLGEQGRTDEADSMRREADRLWGMG